ncbi:growth-regulating factor 4-like [Momordica charantia]|uniref:Growth-regulating factor n=1 Tax=Momordica charantia TaxID=3673 RepID=A0A6J1CT46_MOMCH|nr:growth-regulating factor 4-like [Momordica charantia]
MDFHLKQCRNLGESEQQHSGKISKFLAEPSASASALSLFVPDSDSKTSSSTILSAFPDYSTSSTTATAAALPNRMWGYFSVAQRQELELQALIFRYMVAGAAVPPELLHSIKKSLLSSTPFFLYHPLQHFSHYPTSLLQAGYWGRAAMDPEPGRCRRTDGKKWRCSRDVVAGQKYCERHMHRGRNRSRKPVEPTTAATGAGAGGGHLGSNTNRVSGRALLTAESGNGNYFSLSGQSPSVDLLHLNQRGCSDSLPENKNFYESHKGGSAGDGDGKSDGHILRHFFDDWPRSDHGRVSNNSQQQMNSASASTTSLSISISGNPSMSSDVSLKLSTGGSSDQVPGGSSDGYRIVHQEGNADREQVQLNWAAGWAATQMASMGGPLAEALRSSANYDSSSPTSVLHQLQRATTSEASFIST